MKPSKIAAVISAVLALLVVKQDMLISSFITRISVEKSLRSQSGIHSTTAVSATMPTIPQLVGSTDDYKCPEGLVVVKDSIDPSFHEKNQRNIPKVIHMTSKTRCMTQAFASNVDRWRFEGHTLFLHDDDAVDRLLDRWWPEFPSIHDVKKCMMPGAAIADLWRYVVLWEYGGIYTDIDNSPGPWLWNESGSAITNTTDALFEQERGRFPSQYFFAASPHHPVMYLAVQNALLRVMEVKSIMKQYVPFVTGPGAIKAAVVSALFPMFLFLSSVCLYFAPIHYSANYFFP
jgi:mannosyltransferase OCH1-like enzyme